MGFLVRLNSVSMEGAVVFLSEETICEALWRENCDLQELSLPWLSGC